jgi:hypothetical protein
MRDNPDNNILRNLVGKETDHTNDPETPPQSEVARNPNHTNISDVARENQSEHITQSDHIARNPDHTNIRKDVARKRKH